MVKEYHSKEHLELPVNNNKLMFDDAVEFFSEFCEGLDMDSINSVKYHINTWGLSTNNWFADNVMSKLKNIESIDF